MTGLDSGLTRLFSGRPGQGIAYGELNVQLPTFSAEATAYTSASPDASLEHRIEVLEGNVKALNVWLTKAREDLRKESADRRAADDATRSEVRQLRSGLEGTIKALAVGDIIWEWLGFAWLLLGTFVATFW